MIPANTIPASLSYEELVRELDARQRERGPVAGAALPAPDPRTRRMLADVDEAQLLAAARAREFDGGDGGDDGLDIYGRDNRRDVYTLHPGPRRRASGCVAAFVTCASLTPSDGGFSLSTVPYGPSLDLCRSERFYEQPTAAYGTGFLVAADVLATAGHLAIPARLWGANDAPLTAFLFGFEMLDATRARTWFAPEDVYYPRSIIHSVTTDSGPDWALIRLDRPVVDRVVPAIRTSGAIADGAHLYMYGYPRGLPEKFAGGARVRDNSHSAFFKANLDAYSNDSGSPVFNLADNVVEGIAVRGMPGGDFYYKTSQNCRVSMRYPNSMGGEACTRTTEFARYL